MDVKYPQVTVPLIGRDANAFAIIGAVTAALRAAGEREGAADYASAAMDAESYDALLQLTMTTVDVC